MLTCASIHSCFTKHFKCTFKCFAGLGPGSFGNSTAMWLECIYVKCFFVVTANQTESKQQEMNMEMRKHYFNDVKMKESYFSSNQFDYI